MADDKSLIQKYYKKQVYVIPHIHSFNWTELNWTELNSTHLNSKCVNFYRQMIWSKTYNNNDKNKENCPNNTVYQKYSMETCYHVQS